MGVTISSVFSSLLDPAYKATVTDLLTPEQYTKASGLVGVAGSAKYLISPVLAGLLLTISDIRLLLLLDTATFFLNGNRDAGRPERNPVEAGNGDKILHQRIPRKDGMPSRRRRAFWCWLFCLLPSHFS